MFSGTAQVSQQVCFVFFFWSVLCIFLCMWLVDKNKAVVCCLLATSAIMLSEKKKRKRKMWSKKWYLRRNISYDAHLLNELLETDVPWDDASVVSAGKLRKLWDSLSELRTSLCERRLERTVLKLALLPVKTAQFTQFNWECIAPFRDIDPSSWNIRSFFFFRNFRPFKMTALRYLKRQKPVI